MGKTVAILQSNYIPWKGYFDLINSVDEFVIFDEMQFTRRDWRNRNKIKTANGLQWLTIPVEAKGKYAQKISETKISDRNWTKKHWHSLQHAYAKAPCFAEFAEEIARLYARAAELAFLSEVNYLFMCALCEILGITTKFSFDRDYGVIAGKSERLLDLVQKAGGSLYLSGPAAKDYLDEIVFQNAGVMVEWMDYSGYPEYPQLHGGFKHEVSILDLIFNVGAAEAPKYMKSFN